MPATRTLATLTASRLSVSLGGRAVLHDVSVVVAPGTRLGIVGPNGAGKTTLLRTLAGSLHPDSGSVTLAPPTATVGYLAQERERSTTETGRQALHRRTGAADAEAELHQAAEGLADPNDPDAHDRYAAALERYERLGAGDIDARIEAVAADLGLPARTLDLPTAALSGGQAALMSLAAILLSRFDLTLLDEPTNDLDFNALDRLERFVNNQEQGLVVVSHDREFLSRTINTVLELDEHDHTASLYAGGYDAFLEERATARRHAEEDYAVYQSQRGELLDRARRERQWATSGTAKERKSPKDNDKAQRGFRIDKTEKLAAKARQTERRLERLQEVDKPWEGWDLRFSIEEAPRAGAIVAVLNQAVVHRGDFVIGPVDIEIGWGERVLLQGRNGSGKTTLINALLGRTPLDQGTQRLGPSTVVGELGQDRAALTVDAPLADAFRHRTGLTVNETRSLLAKFGLTAEHVARPARSLSPGERTRAELAMLQARGVNFLVLDEPSNHLDLPGIEQLEQALSSYTGTLLLVTHDRRLLDAVAVDRVIDLG